MALKRAIYTVNGDTKVKNMKKYIPNDELFQMPEPVSEDSSSDTTEEGPKYAITLNQGCDRDRVTTSYIYELLSGDDYTPVYLTPSNNKNQLPEKLLLEALENNYAWWPPIYICWSLAYR